MQYTPTWNGYKSPVVYCMHSVSTNMITPVGGTHLDVQRISTCGHLLRGRASCFLFGPGPTYHLDLGYTHMEAMPSIIHIPSTFINLTELEHFQEPKSGARQVTGSTLFIISAKSQVPKAQEILQKGIKFLNPDAKQSLWSFSTLYNVETLQALCTKGADIPTNTRLTRPLWSSDFSCLSK